MSYTSNYPFSNLHENVNFEAERWYVLKNADDSGVVNDADSFLKQWVYGISNIMGVLADAKDNSKKVRAVGGTWSLSQAQQTPDYLINTSSLNLVQVGLLEGSVQPGIDLAPWCLSQCGASVMDINERLREANLALSTTGASDGQSIAGAFSTGTHGSAFTFGAMPDYVEALHIVVSDTVHYWVEGSAQIVTDDFIAAYAPGAGRINNDDILNSAVVSFGSFGIIHACLLKVEPLYALNHVQLYTTLDKVKPCLNFPADLSGLGLPNDNLYNFTAVGSPYLPDNYVAHTMQKLPYDPANPINPPVKPTFRSPGADALAVIGDLSGMIPSLIPDIMKFTLKTIQQNFPETPAGGTMYLPGWAFTNGTAVSKGKALSVEICIDATGTQAAADVIFGLCKNTPFPGLISFRYVKQSKAVLGFTKYPIGCTIEFPAAFSPETETFYKALYTALNAAGIEFTFHWGQCNNLDSAGVIKKYGSAAINTWLKARSAILQTPQQRLMFTNDFLIQLGLDGVPPLTA